MTKLKLYGRVGCREIAVPPRVVSEAIPDTDTAKRQSFAIVHNLKSQLEKVGITEQALWSYILAECDVSSRKDLSEYEWVRLAARLSAAERNKHLFDVFVEDIKACVGECRAYREHADGSCKTIYEGLFTEDIEERCQRHADKSGCLVRLHGADGILFFDPAPKCRSVAEIDTSTPARVFEVQRLTTETHYIEIPVPDCSDLAAWGQRHANQRLHDIQITACDGKTPLMQFEPQAEVSGNAVVIAGVTWILLNQWEDKWHWVKLDRSMERYIAQAESREHAITKVLEYVKKRR